MTIAGLQHIMNNLLCDVHVRLSHWDAFYAEAKQFESLLTIPERRSRFVWTYTYLSDSDRLIHDYPPSPTHPSFPHPHTAVAFPISSSTTTIGIALFIRNRDMFALGGVWCAVQCAR